MKKIKRSMVVLFAIMFLISGFAMAEEKGEVTKLEDISVTATRTERTTEETPASVSTVTREDIKNTRMFNIKETITGVPGVQAESRNGGYDARLIIRGAGLKARYGVREIMILLDGVPITDPDGMSRLDFVDTQLIEQIDIVKGPNSTLYGANAAGGVINIITRSPYEEAKSMKLAYESYNTQLYNLIYGTSLGKTYLTFSGSSRSTDSWRKWNKFSTSQGNIKAGHTIDNTASLELTMNYTKADIQLPGSLTKSQFESNITQRTSEPWRHSGRYSNSFFTNLKFEKEIDNIKLKPIVFFNNWNHYHPVTGIINDGGANIYGTDIQADIKHNLSAIEGTLTTGVTGQVDRAEGKQYAYRDYVSSSGRVSYTLSDSKGDVASDNKDTTTKWGGFVQESVRPSDKWIIDAGVRYDHVAFDISNEIYKEYNFSSGRYTTKRETINRAKNYDSISPRIGVVHKLNDALNLYGNISTGFQTPQSSEIGVNAKLNPLKSYNYEIGLKYRREGGHSLDLSLFDMYLTDEIVQIIEPGNISSYNNAGKSRKSGLESSVKIQPLYGLFLGGSYTYSDFKFNEFTEPISGVNYKRNGNRFPYIPIHQYSLYAYYKHSSGFKFKVDTNTWGEYYVDNANSDKYGGYELLTNALIGYEKKNIDVSFNLYNVFDKRYAMEVTKSGNTLYYKSGSPLTAMLKMEYNF